MGSESTFGVPSAPLLEEEELPPGWERKLAPDGRVFFTDHNTRTTHWSALAASSGATSSTTAPASTHIDRSGLGPLPSGWEERTLPNGRVFFVNQQTGQTTWQDPRCSGQQQHGARVQFSNEYKYKYDRLMRRLEPLGFNGKKFVLRVSRDTLVEDSIGQISRINKEDTKQLRYKLWVEYSGEEGLDYGGLSREWFSSLTTDIFNPYYGLFEYSATDNYTLQINPNSGLCNETHLELFHFIGRVLGMAVFHRNLISGFFIRPFYSMMLGRPITLESMESVDAEYHQSLLWIMENDPKCLELTFQVDEEVLGQQVTKELLPGGAGIPVTEENKTKYIKAVIQWRFVARVRHQMDKVMEGFHDIIPLGYINTFDEGELELLLGGIGSIDVGDWREHTVYKGCGNIDSFSLLF